MGLVRAWKFNGRAWAGCAVTLALAAAGSSCQAQSAQSAAQTAEGRAALAMQSLLKHYWNSALGTFQNSYPVDAPGDNYWWQANAIDALAEGVQLRLDAPCTATISALYTSVMSGGTALTQYFDDENWMGLGLLHAYRATRDKDYLRTAQELFTDVYTQGWSKQGGIVWNRTGSTYRNTPANAPAALLGASLYLATGNRADLLDAKRIYAWEWTHLVTHGGIVWDGLQGNTASQGQYSYNYGTIIGASLRLWQATRDPVYLGHAELVARRSVQVFTSSPSMQVVSEGQGDGGLFNGIYVRYLTWLVRFDPRDRLFRELIAQNAQNAWAHDRTAQDLFGTNWSGHATPPNGMNIDLSTELSGVFLMNQAASLYRGTIGL